MNTTLSPLVHLFDDDAAMRDSLAQLIRNYGERGVAVRMGKTGAFF